MIEDVKHLVEADWHVANLHHRIVHQRNLIAELKRSGMRPVACVALLALMMSMVPKVEDHRQQLLATLANPTGLPHA